MGDRSRAVHKYIDRRRTPSGSWIYDYGDGRGFRSRPRGSDHSDHHESREAGMLHLLSAIRGTGEAQRIWRMVVDVLRDPATGKFNHTSAASEFRRAFQYFRAKAGKWEGSGQSLEHALSGGIHLDERLRAEIDRMAAEDPSDMSSRGISERPKEPDEDLHEELKSVFGRDISNVKSFGEIWKESCPNYSPTQFKKDVVEATGNPSVAITLSGPAEIRIVSKANR